MLNAIQRINTVQIVELQLLGVIKKDHETDMHSIDDYFFLRETL